jgi:type IV fimbrial biogenesis protein FimT
VNNTIVAKGFTLLEIMISIGVLAIMLSLAVPAYNELVKNNRISTQANALHTALMLSRSEALTRLSRVTVCSSSDGSSCASGGWEQGWIVFLDPDNDATVDNNETILRIDSAITGGNTFRGNSNVANYVSFVGDGASMTTSGTFQTGTWVVCDDRGFTSSARAISINATGRPRVQKATASTLTSCTP